MPAIPETEAEEEQYDAALLAEVGEPNHINDVPLDPMEGDPEGDPEEDPEEDPESDNDAKGTDDDTDHAADDDPKPGSGDEYFVESDRDSDAEDDEELGNGEVIDAQPPSDTVTREHPYDAVLLV